MDPEEDKKHEEESSNVEDKQLFDDTMEIAERVMNENRELLRNLART